jgi:hypothetical protein
MTRREASDPKLLQQTNKMPGFVCFLVLGIKPRALGMVDSTTELQPNLRPVPFCERAACISYSVPSLFPLPLFSFK